MTLDYTGWCRRNDLNFRARFPYIATRLFKVGCYDFHLYISCEIDDFPSIESTFNREIKTVTAPIKLVTEIPATYEEEIEIITDDKIPSNFEGFPLTVQQIYTHIMSIHSEVEVSKVTEDHSARVVTVEVVINGTTEIGKIQKTVDDLKGPYSFKVNAGNDSSPSPQLSNEVFNIRPSQVVRHLNCPFIERDEALWYEKVEEIYRGEFKKSDLYFYDPKKSSCLVNFSVFQNANLRNHLLLYDVVFCVLPLVDEMKNFLSDQKITKAELLELVRRGRLIILNIQPESRLDYGFINEAYQETPTAVVSRRALSALCAIDLVEMNRSYIFSDSELDKHIFPFMRELASLTNVSIDTVSKFLLWPKEALRKSLYVLNESGPMGISNYGINNAIASRLPEHKKDELDFEFTVHSDRIHLAHALNATYFPFFINGDKYSDHPYAVMMGGLLNLYKNFTYQSSEEIFDIHEMIRRANPSLSLISTFDINDYISILDFDQDISSRVVRNEMNSLFSELTLLDGHERNERIAQYNEDLERELKNINTRKHALDLAEDTAGLVIPFLGTGKKLLAKGTEKAMDKFPAIQTVAEFIEDKTTTKNDEKQNIKLLAKVNRVARLKKTAS